MNQIALISTFPPTQCGIASYSNDLLENSNFIDSKIRYVPINLVPENHEIFEHSIFKKNIIQSKLEDYLQLAEWINYSDIIIVNIQHEFKLFGKPFGENILPFINSLKKPIVTTLHTVWNHFPDSRAEILKEIVRISSAVFVFSEKTKLSITSYYCNDSDKIHIIPHGVPSIENEYLTKVNVLKTVDSSPIFISFGHLRASKGYDVAIHAFSKLKEIIPNFNYFILGSNHPQNDTAIAYREKLKHLILELRLEDNVHFINRFLPKTELIGYIQMADVGLTPYLSKEQSSSGVLALLIACGKPIISTPFEFAQYIISPNSGFIAKGFQATDFENVIEEFLNTPDELINNMRTTNYQIGKQWSWKEVAMTYQKVSLEILKKTIKN